MIRQVAERNSPAKPRSSTSLTTCFHRGQVRPFCPSIMMESATMCLNSFLLLSLVTKLCSLDLAGVFPVFLCNIPNEERFREPGALEPDEEGPIDHQISFGVGAGYPHL